MHYHLMHGKHKIVYNKIPCSPCQDNSNKCKSLACLETITHKDVLEKIEEIFKGEKMPKILIINFGGLGDMIYTTPIFREIKKNLPDSSIAFLTEPKYSEVFYNNPYIDRLILFDKYKLNMVKQFIFYLNLRAEKFDITIDLPKSARGRMFTFMSGAKKKGWF